MTFKIPPTLPLLKGGSFSDHSHAGYPLFKEGLGRCANFEIPKQRSFTLIAKNH